MLGSEEIDRRDLRLDGRFQCRSSLQLRGHRGEVRKPDIAPELLELAREAQALEDVFRDLTLGDERKNRDLTAA